MLYNGLGITSKPTFWGLGDNSFFALVIVPICRSWLSASLLVQRFLVSGLVAGAVK